MRVTKDGNQIFEIPDTDEDIKTAAEKGYVPVVQVSKNGTDWYDIKGTEDEITLAISKGYKTRTPAKEPEQYTKTESALRGAAAGAIFDWDDEAGGVAGALLGRGSYEEVRDRIRQQKKDAAEQNPWSYMGGSFVGGAVMPVGAASTAKTVIGAVGAGALAGGITGGIQGAGANEVPEDLLGDTAGGAAKGTVLGGLTGGAANVLGRSLTQGGRQSLADEVAAFSRGTKQEVGPLADVAGVKQLKSLWNGAKETLDSAGAIEDFRKFLRADREKLLARMTDDGVPKNDILAARPLLDKMSDDEYVIMRLAEDGENEVKKWVADSATSSFPGRLKSEDYQEVLAKGTSERNRINSLDTDQIGRDLLPQAKRTQDLFSVSTKDRVNQLSNQAAQKFSGTDDDARRVFETVQLGLKDAGKSGTISGGVSKRLKDVQKILETGEAPSHRGLAEGAYDEVSDIDRYRRYRTARTVLDEGIDWLSTEKGRDPDGERILKDVRQAIDQKLKSTPGQAEADAVYEAMKDLEKSVFKNAEFGGELDIYKLARLLNNADASKRFRDSLSQLRAWSTDSRFPAFAREEAKKFVDQFEKAAADYAERVKLNNFKYTDGPSSASVQRLGSKLNQNSLVQDAVQNPTGFVNQMDEFVRGSQDFTGKPFSKMTPQEKSAFAKTWVWFNKNAKEGKTPTEQAKRAQYGKFLGKPDDGGTLVSSPGRVLEDLGQQDSDVVLGYFQKSNPVLILEDDLPELADLPLGRRIGGGAEQSYYEVTYKGKKALLSKGMGPAALWIDEKDAADILKKR